MEATVEDTLNKRSMSKELQGAFELFEKGKKGLESLHKLKNAIIFFGPTGSGKSSYILAVSTDGSEIVVKELYGEYILDDGNEKIGKSFINSKTINPDRFTTVLESGEVVNIFDVGGFGDTRKMKYDLAVNLLIKTVADLTDSVKMIFSIAHPFVRPQVDKAMFLNLLRHITDLVKDINKFRHGIALLVTKVDNITIKMDNQRVLLDDKSVVENVAKFLFEVKQELKENLMNNVGDKEHYKKNAIKIIDILLTKNAESFPRIKLFRRPEECGPLRTSSLCQDAKRSFFEIFHSTTYVEKNNDDFGYCLSGDSINVAKDIVEEINQIISANLTIIADIVQKYFQNTQKTIYETIASIMAGAADARDHQTAAKELASEFRDAVCVIGKFIDKVKLTTNNEKVVRIVQEHISHLKVEIPEDIITDLINQVKYLDFLKTACKREFSMRSPVGIFSNILLFVQALKNHLQKHIDECVKKTEIHLKSALEGLTTAIEKEYTKQMKTLGPERVLSMLEKEKLIFSTMVQTIPFAIGSKKQIEAVCNIDNDLSISFPADVRANILNLNEWFLYFENLSNKDNIIDLSSHCILTLQAVENCFQKFQSWYKYLRDLHDNGLQYEIQKVKDMYNVKNLRNWGNSKAEKGIYITQENFELFLKKASSISLAECSSVKNLQLSGLRQEELNHILDLIFKNEIEIIRTENSVTVQGVCISLKYLFSSEHNAHFNNGTDSFLTILSNSKIKTVRLFAFHTIFIDHDLDFVGKKISLVCIAPKWEVIGTRKIDVSGKVGDEPPTDYPTDYPEASAYPNKANDGAPGNPGGPGGNFFGIVETIINGDNLTIFANGGNGGDGQRGQDGNNGNDATLETLGSVINNVCNCGLSLPSWVLTTLTVCGKLSRGSAVPIIVGDVASKIAINVLKRNQFVLEKGEKGQDGGNGGKGGRGGNSGKILIHCDGTVNVFFNCGFPGQDGSGGFGGQSGRNKVLTGSEREGIIVELVEGEEPGANGSNGLNCTAQKHPDPAPAFKCFDCVSDFKKTLNSLIADRFRELHLLKFMNFIDTIPINEVD